MFFARVAFLLALAVLLASGTTLPPDEVRALQQIAGTLRKTDWNFSVDPCSGQQNWSTPNPIETQNAVTCDCSFFNHTVCHVVSIILKAQNLPGSLPPELIKLPYLREIDLTRNYLNGTIPREWGSMQLVNISLLGNRISGSLPKELGNISTLVNLTVEFNQLSETIPPELGNLTLIEKIHLTSNNFTGKLPGTLARLTTLKDFRIGENQFLGSIPNFIQSWTNLEKLVIQASGLSGPMPSGIAFLTKLTDLRISDLNGNDTNFPPLSAATNMKTLILRSCNIVGQLPGFLGSFKKLKLLDLSFNKLSGPIPRTLFGLPKIENIYLTGNFLTGAVPDWMLTKGQVRIDLSYNNFTKSSGASDCQPTGNLNLFGSSSKGNTPGIVSCLRSFSCPESWHSLHINCGGREMKDDDDISYDDDIESGGPSNFVHRFRSNWAFSSTGNFLDDDRPRDSYIWTNNTGISGTNSGLYTEARLSPLSLTYYGFCMQNGNYTVNLHFAEIMFTDDRTYSSLGRRIFDIYIQENLMLKDFNIEDEAGGVNRPVIRKFTAVVTDNTLAIRLFWAGKGTTGIPVRGVYGPLISAISVDPDFRPHGKSLPAGAVAAIVIAILLLVTICVLWWKGCLRCRDTVENDLKGLDLQTGSFTLRQIKAATNNFDAANKIGEGGFGSVYKGHLADGTIIAVKQLSSKSKQGNREFVNEIGMISALQHPNLVKLYGCCVEGNQLLLVYEYMENNSLARALFGPEEHKLELDWPTRHKISVGIARGLAYLHEESRLKIVHRDIKATNVLLDKYLNPKISDFGLAKLDDEESTHISTRIAGTYGYMAPEYAMRGYLTDKADVYSYGVVLLEIVSGRSNANIKPRQDGFHLLDWAKLLKEEGKLMELVDPRLGSNLNEEEVMLTIHIALLCTDVSPTVRPGMSTVVSKLEGRAVDAELLSELSFSSNKVEPSKEITNQQQVPNSDERYAQHVSMEVPFTASSTSAADLYPINIDSDYLMKRL
nr:probable leucine-rich repeat receptor-like serine/threonine-protein kinase At3g14840 [Coffea arabica]